jgi:aminoethylphosphonate catabolism LysR family transcriptional regulator
MKFRAGVAGDAMPLTLRSTHVRPINETATQTRQPIDLIYTGAATLNEPSLSELKAFDAAARCGSMSAAARALGLRQPTVSAHVARIESHFGVELFHRRGHQLQLTPFGHTLRDVTHRIFRAEEDALAMLASARSCYSGRLALCAVGPYNVTPMLKRFRARWPAVSLAVSVGDSRQIVEQVLDFRGDLGVLVHAVDDPRIHCVPYRRQRLIVMAPRDHALAVQRTVRLQNLQGQAFVVREEGSSTRRVFDQALAAAGISIQVALEFGSREAVREAVAQGLGLGVVADAAFLPDPRLVPLAIEGPGLYTHPHVICLAERRQVPLVASFLTVVDELRREAQAGETKAAA